ncbi:type IV toxin-antitoxin system AbiEi family antitoxin domain-containing protein [Nocardioides sp.]|uniref:type IV toxin-antitoxin system AbiEi family antitoxin domain-containing protein n=1 Tax=Nocardioides sp. TaxID=35761 RepID=UPI003D13D96E
MDPLRVLDDTQGFFTRSQAREFGYDDKAVSRALRLKVWHRIRRGYYTHTDVWAGLDQVSRHLVLAHSVADSLGDRVALSGPTGCLAHGIATWDLDLTRVHVTRLDGGAGRIEGDVVHHEGFWAPEDLRRVHGSLVLSPERCALEAGSRVRGGAKLVLLDSLLNLGLATPKALEDQFRLMCHWPFMRSMQIPVRMADAGAQSPGESLGRYLFWAAHLPAPLLQFTVYDERGNLVGTCDWGWPDHGLLGEFDGRIKYGRLVQPGQSAGDVVFSEKQREDLLREVTGWPMVRLIWEDLNRPNLTTQRMRRFLHRLG